MPTPYERYVTGWKRAEEEMTRRKQMALQAQGVGFEERRVDLGEQRFGFEEAQWPAQKALMEARTEEIGREEPVPIKDRLIQKIYEQGAESLAPGELALAYGLDILDRPTAGRGAEPTAYMRNQMYSLGMLRKDVTRQQQATGVPQGPEAIRRMAEERFMQKKYGGGGVGAGPTIGTPEFERLYQSMLKGLPPYTPVEQRPTRQEYLQRIQGEGGGVAPTDIIPAKFAILFKEFSSKEDALADALKDLQAGNIDGALYGEILKWANQYDFSGE